MKEIIIICVGQFGLQAGHSFWQQMTKDHASQPQMYKIRTLFDISEQNESELIPRTIFVDSDPLTVNFIKKQANSSKYQHAYCSKQSSGSIYSRASYYVYAELVKEVEIGLNKLINKCDNLQGFIILFSPHSAMGSVAGRISELLGIQHSKKSILGICMFPSPDHGNGPMEIYNFAGCFNFMDRFDLIICMNNQGIYHALEVQAGMDHVNYQDTNEVVSRVVSSVLVGSLETKKGNREHMDLIEIVQGLVPFPALKYVQCSLAPLVTRENLFKYEKTFSQNMVGNHLLEKMLFFNSKAVGKVILSVLRRLHVFGMIFEQAVELILTV